MDYTIKQINDLVRTRTRENIELAFKLCDDNGFAFDRLESVETCTPIIKWLSFYLEGYEDVRCGLINMLNLSSLNLSNKSIKGLPEPFPTLTKLLWLNLSGNSLLKIPNTIANLCSLMSTKLEYNYIRYLPNTIYKLQSLKYVHLQNNLLKELPESIGDLKKGIIYNFTLNQNNQNKSNQMSAGRRINTKNKHWGTPLKYVKAITDFFGGEISLDPCSNEYSIVKAKKEFVLPLNNGLVEEWDYKTIYVNPPYGIDKENGTRIKDWFRKSVESHQKYNSEIIMLVPVATNTSHWKEYVYTYACGICLLYDTRLKFLENGNACGKGAPMACSIVYYGEDFSNFLKKFREYGAVINTTHLNI